LGFRHETPLLNSVKLPSHRRPHRSIPCFLSTTYSIMPLVSFRDPDLAPSVLLLLKESLPRRPLSSNVVRCGRCHVFLGN